MKQHFCMPVYLSNIMTYECAIFRTYTITQLKSVLGEGSPFLAVPAARVLLSWGRVPCVRAHLQQLCLSSFAQLCELPAHCTEIRNK